MPAFRVQGAGTGAWLTSTDAIAPMALTQLNLAGNNITDDGFAMLMPLLKKGGKLCNLTGFGIGSHVTDKGMTNFTEILSMGAMAKLEELWLQGNQIGDSGMAAFADAIAANDALDKTLFWRAGGQFRLEGNPGSCAPVEEAFRARMPSMAAERAALEKQLQEAAPECCLS